MTSSSQPLKSLSPKEWFNRIRLLDERLAADRIQLEPALRHAFHLLQLAPGPLNDMFGISITEEKFEEWLDAEAWHEAAEALVAEHLPITISQPNGHVTVRVEGLWFDAANECTDAELPHAVLGAWLGCILEIQEKASEKFFTHPNPGQHELRYGPRPLSKPH